MISVLTKKILLNKLVNEGVEAFLGFIKENPQVAKFFNIMTEEEQSEFLKVFDEKGAGGFDIATVIGVGGDFILPSSPNEQSIYGPGAIVQIRKDSIFAPKFHDPEKQGVVIEKDPKTDDFPEGRLGWVVVDFGNDQTRALRYNHDDTSDIDVIEPAVFEISDREMITLSFPNGSKSVHTNILGLDISFGDSVLVNHQNGFIVSVKKDQKLIGHKAEILRIIDAFRLEIRIDGSTRIVYGQPVLIEKCTKGDVVLVDVSYSAILELLEKKARIIAKDSAGKITLDDVIGLEDAKTSMNDYILERENRTLYASALEGTVHSSIQSAGILLVGPPGNGKTMLMKAAANSHNATLLTLNSTEALQKYVGDGPAMIRNLADEATKIANEDHLCIIFIDEIDAIGRKRSDDGQNEHLNALTNALLTSMDGTDSSSNVLWVAATNRGDLLDDALTRDGRLDQTFYVGRPTGEAVRELFALYLKGVKSSVSHEKILDLAVAQYTERKYALVNILLEGETEKTTLYLENFGSGAMIENIVSTAIRKALRRDVSAKNKNFSGITLGDIEESFRESFNSLKSKNLENAIEDYLRYETRTLINIEYLS